jgi:hypothetical protein
MISTTLPDTSEMFRIVVVVGFQSDYYLEMY